MEVTKKAVQKLRERKGNTGFATPVALLLIILVILLALIEVIHLYSMVMGVSDYTQQAVLQTAASNAYNAYNGVREGNSSAHIYTGTEIWTEMVSTAEVSRRLQQTLQLEKNGNTLQRKESGVFKYAISDIQVRCTNVEVGADGNARKLTFHVKAIAEIPVRFLGILFHVKKQISFTSYYTPLF